MLNHTTLCILHRRTNLIPTRQLPNKCSRRYHSSDKINEYTYLLIGIVGVAGILIIAGMVGYQLIDQQSDEKYQECLANFWEMNPNPILGNNKYLNPCSKSMYEFVL